MWITGHWYWLFHLVEVRGVQCLSGTVLTFRWNRVWTCQTFSLNVTYSVSRTREHAYRTRATLFPMTSSWFWYYWALCFDLLFLIWKNDLPWILQLAVKKKHSFTTDYTIFLLLNQIYYGLSFLDGVTLSWYLLTNSTRQ